MQMDGSMVQTREESWKEVRNGMLFKEQDCVQVDKHHKSIFKKQYFSVFNGRKDSLQATKKKDLILVVVLLKVPIGLLFSPG